MQQPSEAVQDKVHFIFNNIAAMNIAQKVTTVNCFSLREQTAILEKIDFAQHSLSFPFSALHVSSIFTSSKSPSKSF